MYVAAILTSEESSVVILLGLTLDIRGLEIRHAWAVHVYKHIRISRNIRIFPSNDDGPGT